MKKVLFVCAGNQCRSPIAEGLFRKIIEDNKLTEHVYIDSGGVSAYDEAPPTKKACEVMRKKNIDITKKLSKLLDREIVGSSDIIITMEDKQKALIQSIYPEFKEKVFGLKELANECGDIEDPIGGSFEDYENCAREIENSLTKAKSKIFKILTLP